MAASPLFMLSFAQELSKRLARGKPGELISAGISNA
jgi:hypothetical protein